MRLRARSDVAHRLGQLEDAFGAEPKCRCGLPDNADPRSRSITSALPGDYPDLDPPENGGWGRIIYEPCPDCGLERLVYVTLMLGAS